VLIVAVAAVLVSTWQSPPALLTQERAAGRKEPALRLIVPPAKRVPTTQTALNSESVPDVPAPGEPRRAKTPAPRPIGEPGANSVVKLVPPGTRPASWQPSPTDATQAGNELRAGLEAKRNDKLLEARDRINRALHSGLSVADARLARQALAELADRTLFTRAVVKGDPLAAWHTIRSGDTLGRIAERAGISEDFLARINALPNKNFIREGQRIKVLQGPFHAAISKGEHRMHLYLQDVYCRTLRVALGEHGSTPTCRWKVINHLTNPGWTDPRSHKRWHPDDPANPIGEYWIGLEGLEGEAASQFGYGIHGTIEPETIGQDISMGCIRLAPDDIALVYKLLVPGHSLVTISE